MRVLLRFTFFMEEAGALGLPDPVAEQGWSGSNRPRPTSQVQGQVCLIGKRYCSSLEVLGLAAKPLACESCRLGLAQIPGCCLQVGRLVLFLSLHYIGAYFSGPLPPLCVVFCTAERSVSRLGEGEQAQKTWHIVLFLPGWFPGGLWASVCLADSHPLICIAA